jgi:hypothetical protein
MQWTPAAKSVAIIYGGTPDGSPARRLLVDLHVACGESYWMSFTKTKDFQRDVVYDIQDKVQRLNLRMEDLKAKDYAPAA